MLENQNIVACTKYTKTMSRLQHLQERQISVERELMGSKLVEVEVLVLWEEEEVVDWE